MIKKILLKTIFSVLAVLLTAELIAQVPQGFNFQAVAWDLNGDLITNTQLGVQITILRGGENGTAVYTETQTPTTNTTGSMNLVIGEGTSEDSFTAIDWAADNYFVKLSIDPAGGTDYETLGTTRLLSVPYALLAENVVNGSGISANGNEINLDYSAGDTSYVINQFGDNADDLTPAFIVNSELSGINQAINANTVSQTGSAQTQYGISGSAKGNGTGTHIGILGSAVHSLGEGEGGRRYGLYGQARSNGRENIGGFGLGIGAGDGEVVGLGDELASGEFNVGGFNIGLVGFGSQNLNGNIGIRGYVYGTEGARENRAVSAEAVVTASGRNVGVQSIFGGSEAENIGFQALTFDNGSGTGYSPKNTGFLIELANEATEENYGIKGSITGSSLNNTGMQLDVSGGTNSNIGLIVNADVAAELTGTVYIGGDINYTGALNSTSDRNLKDNIAPLESGISTIMKLQPTTYNFRGNGEYKGMKLSKGLHYGLIAQEVEQVLPSLVKDRVHTYYDMDSKSAGPDPQAVVKMEKTMNYKTMNYTELIPILIKGMQEQQVEINRLKEELKKLRKEK